MTDHREGRADARSPHGVSRDDGTPDARIARRQHGVSHDDGTPDARIARRQHGVAHEAGTPDARIAHIARRQHGVVSRRQALEAGLGSTTVHRRVEAGRWVRLQHGVYRVGIVPAPLEWAAAVCLAVGADAVISHTSAAYLRGWMSGEPPEPPHITVPGRRPRARVGLRLHGVPSLATSEKDRASGFPVTGAERTLLDIASMLATRDLERVVAHALKNDELSVAQLDHLRARCRGRPGCGKLRAVIDQSGGARFTRSEAEARFLELIRSAELPIPRTNARLGPFELDAIWTRERVVVEVDGYAFHRSRDRFESDRRKDAWLMARGYRVIRVTWRQLTEHPTRTAVQVGRALEAATKR
ncbi:type IV toxin-antitoxin system AbiEi family antitoxin domain-containing protein [Gemmatimonadota bacterium Y43]|uniref:type IV toxin-antitoxin system AbiEi family antitoxin domain-containing protein n=1 Tax=Gaopeijia maritima TaxID=3119007 RepID=UPI003291B67D